MKGGKTMANHNHKKMRPIGLIIKDVAKFLIVCLIKGLWILIKCAVVAYLAVSIVDWLLLANRFHSWNFIRIFAETLLKIFP